MTNLQAIEGGDKRSIVGGTSVFEHLSCMWPKVAVPDDMIGRLRVQPQSHAGGVIAGKRRRSINCANLIFSVLICTASKLSALAKFVRRPIVSFFHSGAVYATVGLQW